MVTTFLSNDAVSVVLTQRWRSVRQKFKNVFHTYSSAHLSPMQLHLYYPISNPANLVIYGTQMPPLLHRLSLYLIPSICAITATYIALYLTQRSCFKDHITTEIDIPNLSAGGKTAFIGSVLQPVSYCLPLQ